MSIQFNIEIKEKHLYILGAIVVIAVGGMYFSTAYGTSDPSNFGHDYGEIEGVQAEISGSCGSGETLKTIDDDGSIVCEDLPSTSGVPSGAIMIFDKNCPTGWSSFSDLNEGRYPRGSNNPGNKGGSTSHSHSLPSTNDDRLEQLLNDNDNHVEWNTDSSNHLDPYYTVVYCQKN